MGTTRRQASIGLTLAAIMPFQVRAQSVGFGVLVDAIGETITQTANVISAVTEQLNKAVSNGIGIYDKFKLEDLKGKLVRLEGKMSNLNGMKGANINNINFYIKKTGYSLLAGRKSKTNARQYLRVWTLSLQP